ncbi:hypothetical protein [Bradyrhizobium shewense]|uniref:hypothetical protein n=1 Tax=Bradyrhizobium shewense TaxID=1761772 RepID=UPI001FD8C94C|nr:hypothetical protein [Bradyrhizobium shewense]
MTGQRAQHELIGCNDCGSGVSFSALACPREPAGPYVESSEERRLHRIEEKNDQTLIGMMVLCPGIGFFLRGDGRRVWRLWLRLARRHHRRARWLHHQCQPAAF